ncbi:SDR family NAD(P)-dependent oxidoreductase [Alphaproteobacteria bacterium]|nr:SDR family NAD(P)-dependent oxidoreductase [Alphaproteobacteria bacterium]
MAHLFIFGYGYVASHLAEVLSTRGWHMTVTSRSPETVKKTHSNIKVIDFYDEKLVKEEILKASHLLSSIPPLKTGGEPVQQAYGSWLSEGDLPKRRWTGYLSSTHVYGDRQGAWVDETAPLDPHNAMIKDRYEAEIFWQSLPHPAIHIFRLSAIYGPGRSMIDRLKRGGYRPISREGLVFSWIHLWDILRFLMASMEKVEGPPLYNLCDDEPSSSDTVCRFAGELVGIDPPLPLPYESLAKDDPRQKFYGSHKKVRNTLIKKDLGMEMLYPSFREGLLAILQGENPFKE